MVTKDTKIKQSDFSFLLKIQNTATLKKFYALSEDEMDSSKEIILLEYAWGGGHSIYIWTGQWCIINNLNSRALFRLRKYKNILIELLFNLGRQAKDKLTKTTFAFAKVDTVQIVELNQEKEICLVGVGIPNLFSKILRLIVSIPPPPILTNPLKICVCGPKCIGEIIVVGGGWINWINFVGYYQKIDK